MSFGYRDQKSGGILSAPPLASQFKMQAKAFAENSNLLQNKYLDENQDPA